MRWVLTLILGAFFWYILTFLLGFVAAILDVSKSSIFKNYSNIFNFLLYPLGVWIAFKITKTPFFSFKQKLSNKMQEEMNSCMDQIINFCNFYQSADFDITNVFSDQEMKIRSLVSEIKSQVQSIKESKKDDEQFSFEERDLLLKLNKECRRIWKYDLRENMTTFDKRFSKN